MALCYEALKALAFPEVTQRYDEDDAILYALSAGFGSDPGDEGELPFVYERGLEVAPTMAAILAGPGLWFKTLPTGITWHKVVHGAQVIEFFEPLPPRAEVRSRARVSRVADLGTERGAAVVTERDLTDAADGRLYARLQATAMLRGDGGYGGPSDPLPELPPCPARAPDGEISLAISPQAALIFRLTGDRNPLHVDPMAARAAGFERPILHGLCSFAMADRAALRALCGFRPGRLRRLGVRFTRPAFPGDVLSFEFWRGAPGEAHFRARVRERDAVVLDRGFCTYDET